MSEFETCCDGLLFRLASGSLLGTSAASKLVKVLLVGQVKVKAGAIVLT